MVARRSYKAEEEISFDSSRHNSLSVKRSRIISPITVLIPVIDVHLGVLPRAVHSVKNQTIPAEILIVNDGESILPDSEGFVVNTGGKKGSAYARNLGLDHVKTPYVFFLDADDYLLNTGLEILSLALDEYDTCYVYGDWYRFGRDSKLTLMRAKNYDRKYLLQHSLHLVNILIPTDIARSVYFDINYRGWEDWKFHIELGMKGFCGNRVPEPVTIYDMTTSVNREAHNSISEEVYGEIRQQYSSYIEGETEFMACTGCGTKKTRMNLGVAVPPEPIEGMVILEYFGENTAPVNFRVGRNIYRGANDQANRFAQVHPEDVNKLLDRGNWRRVPKTVRPVSVPSENEFTEWRKVNSQPQPKDWRQLFAKDAVLLESQSEPELQETEPKKRRGRPTKNVQTATI